MSEVTKAVKAAELQESWWRFFSRYRLQISDNQANEKIMERKLDARLLPITYENLCAVFDSLPNVELDEFASATTGEVKLRRESEAVAASPDVAIAQMPARVNPKDLPAEWTRDKLVKADRETYKNLYSKYGRDVINDRLAGRS